MAASLAQFATLCEALAATPRKLEKRALIAARLQSLSVEDAARTALYLTAQPFAATDPRTLNLGGAALSKAVAELAQADSAAMHAAYRRHGDLGAAAADLLQRRSPPAESLTLADVESRLAAIAEARGPAAKLRLTLDLLRLATPGEAKYLIKLALGDMRIGVQQSLVEEAIAAAYSAELALVRRAVMLNGSLPEVVSLAAAGRVAEARMKLFHPLGFMLASPVESVEEAMGRFAQEIAAEHGHAAETAPPEAALREAHIEDKYDGIRAQVHAGDPGQPGRVALFSRSRDDMTAAFPELEEAFAGFGRAVVLDGEVLAWSPDSSGALAFSALQQRIGRRRVTAEMRQQTPVVFMAFDLLALDEELLLDLPLSERRARLEALVRESAPPTAIGRGSAAGAQATLFADEPDRDAFPRLVLAPATHLASAEQLERAYAEARERGNEGVMLKALGSTYQPGRRGLAWLKMKRELATLDVVVTAAEFGHGRRAAVLSDYTFAVRDGDVLKNVGKAYSGLTDAEIERLTQFFFDHTLEDFGGLRTVEPTVVLEVAFNNVMRSDRHASGFALRFPRILRIRDDKPVEEIDTLNRVEEIYHSQPEKAASGS